MARTKSISAIETELKKAEDDLKKAQEKSGYPFGSGFKVATTKAGIRKQANHRCL